MCSRPCRWKTLAVFVTVTVLLLIIEVSVFFASSGKPTDTEPISLTQFHYFLRPLTNTSLTKGELQSLVNKPKNTYFYIHGFQSPNLEEAESLKVKDAILAAQQGIDMVALVDWCEESEGVFNYPYVANITVPQVASHVAEEIKWLGNNLSIKPFQIHMAGQSLGAHIMGKTGQLLQQQGVGTIRNMTGLDPAGPLFDEVDLFQDEDRRLSKGDATYVRCIHTDDFLGTYNQMCTEDVYPCEEASCSVFNSCCRHNSVKDLFIKDLNECKCLADEKMEESLWVRFVRWWLQTTGRNGVIVLAVSRTALVCFLVLLVLSFVLGLLIGLEIIICVWPDYPRCKRFEGLRQRPYQATPTSEV